MTISLRAVSMAVLLVLGLGACTKAGSPVSPSLTPIAASDVRTPAQTVSLMGVLRALNVQDRSFTLVIAEGTRLIRADDQTTISDAGSRIRFVALGDGRRVGVRGVDSGRFILAQSIVVLR